MAKRPKSKRKSGKAGRPAERLVISEDPKVALDKLLKPTTKPR